MCITYKKKSTMQSAFNFQLSLILYVGVLVILSLTIMLCKCTFLYFNSVHMCTHMSKLRIN